MVKSFIYVLDVGIILKIRHLWKLKIVIFLHWCIICKVPLITNIKKFNNIGPKSYPISIKMILVYLFFVEINQSKRGIRNL